MTTNTSEQNSISLALWGLKNLQDQLDEIDNSRKVKAAELSAEESTLRKRLAAGETTGDPLQDLVIRAHGYGKDLADVLARYRELEGMLKGKKGEFILLSFHAQIPFKHTMTSVECRDARCYRLGVLTDESLVWAGERGPLGYYSITIPVSQFIYGEGYLAPPNLPPQKGDLFAQMHRHADPHALSLMMEEGYGWKEVLIIGNDAVKKWLNSHIMPELYKVAADALGMLELEPTEEEK